MRSWYMTLTTAANGRNESMARRGYIYSGKTSRWHREKGNGRSFRIRHFKWKVQSGFFFYPDFLRDIFFLMCNLEKHTLFFRKNLSYGAFSVSVVWVRVFFLTSGLSLAEQGFPFFFILLILFFLCQKRPKTNQTTVPGCIYCGQAIQQFDKSIWASRHSLFAAFVCSRYYGTHRTVCKLFMIHFSVKFLVFILSSHIMLVASPQ